jgi:hypothetical protein
MGRLACLGIEQANLNYSMCLRSPFYCEWHVRSSRSRPCNVHTKATRLAIYRRCSWIRRKFLLFTIGSAAAKP